jgi:ABC-type dipeptide/oligopeptide/nickel transport system permease subunit
VTDDEGTDFFRGLLYGLAITAVVVLIALAFLAIL